MTLEKIHIQRLAASLVVAAYAKVRLTPRDLRALTLKFLQGH